jgi:hypothetical protein
LHVDDHEILGPGQAGHEMPRIGLEGGTARDQFLYRGGRDAQGGIAGYGSGRGPQDDRGHGISVQERGIFFCYPIRSDVDCMFSDLQPPQNNGIVQQIAYLEVHVAI